MSSSGTKAVLFALGFALGVIVGPCSLLLYNEKADKRILVPAPRSQAEADYINVISIARKSAGDIYRAQVKVLDRVTRAVTTAFTVEAGKGEEGTARVVPKDMHRTQVVNLKAPAD